MSTVLLALGFVLVFEGLVFALAPRRLENMLRLLGELPPETRRVIGLAAVGAGVAVLWIARSLGA